MQLDESNRDRSYLYGRLLAIAELAERRTYDYPADDKRVPNAKRYWDKFTRKPAETWEELYQKLTPYFYKMNHGLRNWYEAKILAVEARFLDKDIENNTPLTEIYLHGYFCQIADLYSKKEKENEQPTEQN